MRVLVRKGEFGLEDPSAIAACTSCQQTFDMLKGRHCLFMCHARILFLEADLCFGILAKVTCIQVHAQLPHKSGQ